MKKQIVLLMLIIVLLTFILASVWEFWLEDWVHRILNIDHSPKESDKGHWISIIAVVTLTTVFLAILYSLQSNRERKRTQAERTLRSSQEGLYLFRHLMNQSNDAILIIDSETGFFTDVNDTACNNLGYSRDELLKLKPTHIETAIYNEKDRKRLLTYIRETSSFIHEGQHKRKDGSGFPVEVSIKQVFYKEKEYFILAARDITKRKNTETALRESEAKYRNIFEHAPLGIIHFDHKGIITASNEYFVNKILETSLQELIGLNILTRLKNKKVIEAIQLCLTGEYSQYEGRYQSLTGRKNSYVKAEFGPILGDNGTLLGGIGIVEDRTEHYEIEKKLRQALIEQKIILENAVIGIAHIKGGKIVSCNPKFEAIFGYERNELVGESTETHFFSSRKSYVKMRDEIYSLTADGKEHTKEKTVKRKDGTSIWVRGIVKSIDPQDITQGIILITEDITQRKQREEELKLAAAVFQNTTEGIMITDAHGTLQSVNSSFSRITGYSMDDVIGRKASILESGEQDKDFYTNMWSELREKRSWKGELWNRRKGGDVYPELLSISAVENNHGEVLHYVGLFSDISEQKKYEELIQYKANHDPLTDLPNRRMFYESLNRDLAQGERNKSRLALLFLDLDGFKKINDTLGHDIGDLLLQEIARILEKCIRKGDLVARVGGDEFIVLLSGISDRNAGSRVADIILQKIHKPITLKGHPVVIGASIGISCFPDDGVQTDELVKMADDAMYKAKEMGKNNYQFYSNDTK